MVRVERDNISSPPLNVEHRRRVLFIVDLKSIKHISAHCFQRVKYDIRLRNAVILELPSVNMAGIQNEPSMQSSTEPDTMDTTAHAYKLRKQQRRKQERELRKLLAKKTGAISKGSRDVLDLQCKQLLASIIDAEVALVTKNLEDSIPTITSHMVHLGDELTGLGKKLNHLKRKVDDMKWKIQMKHWKLKNKQSKDIQVKEEKSEQEVCVLEQNQN